MRFLILRTRIRFSVKCEKESIMKDIILAGETGTKLNLSEKDEKWLGLSDTFHF